MQGDRLTFIKAKNLNQGMSLFGSPDEACSLLWTCSDIQLQSKQVISHSQYVSLIDPKSIAFDIVQQRPLLSMYLFTHGRLYVKAKYVTWCSNKDKESSDKSIKLSMHPPRSC